MDLISMVFIFCTLQLLSFVCVCVHLWRFPSGFWARASFWARARGQKRTHAKTKSRTRSFSRSSNSETHFLPVWFSALALGKASEIFGDSVSHCAIREDRVDARYKLSNPTAKERCFSKESRPSWKNQAETEHLTAANYYKKEEKEWVTNISWRRTPCTRHKPKRGNECRITSLLHYIFVSNEGNGWKYIALTGANITLILSDLPSFIKYKSLWHDFDAWKHRTLNWKAKLNVFKIFAW